MKKTKLLKTLLIPMLGISAIGMVATIATSCGSNNNPSYVIITANESSTLELINQSGNNPDLKYSTDGINWPSYSRLLNIPAGSALYLKGNNPDGWSHSANYSSLVFRGDVSIYGNVMGLLDNGTKTITSIPCECCFCGLFMNSIGITSISENFLPATTLTDCCYDGMFIYCSSLKTAPELPATTLAENCYHDMFAACSSLRLSPELPAENLAELCYCGMFQGCTSLTTAPELPAAKLARGCYEYMFLLCTNLTDTELPATELADSCYYSMFEDCSKITSVKLGYTGTVADAPERAFDNWVSNVASTGTFYYTGSDTAQNFGFPEDWIIVKDNY